MLQKRLLLKFSLFVLLSFLSIFSYLASALYENVTTTSIHCPFDPVTNSKCTQLEMEIDFTASQDAKLSPYYHTNSALLNHMDDAKEEITCIKIKFFNGWDFQSIGVFIDTILSPMPWWTVTSEVFDQLTQDKKSVQFDGMVELLRMPIAVSRVLIEIMRIQYPVVCNNTVIARFVRDYNEYGNELGNVHDDFFR